MCIMKYLKLDVELWCIHLRFNVNIIPIELTVITEHISDFRLVNNKQFCSIVLSDFPKT